MKDRFDTSKRLWKTPRISSSQYFPFELFRRLLEQDEQFPREAEWFDDDLDEDGKAWPHTGQDRDQHGLEWSDLRDSLEAIEDPGELMDAALSLIEKVDDLDGALAEELVEQVGWRLVAKGRRAELERLFDAIRRGRPEAWQQEREALTRRRVENLARIPDSDPVAPARSLLDRPAGSIETFLELADLLRYHGRTHGLCQGMMQDWPRLCDAPGLGDDELDDRLFQPISDPAK